MENPVVPSFSESPLVQPVGFKETMLPRTIVLCFDGTGNKFGEVYSLHSATNMWRPNNCCVFTNRRSLKVSLPALIFSHLSVEFQRCQIIQSTRERQARPTDCILPGNHCGLSTDLDT